MNWNLLFKLLFVAIGVITAGIVAYKYFGLHEWDGELFAWTIADYWGFQYHSLRFRLDERGINAHE